MPRRRSLPTGRGPRSTCVYLLELLMVSGCGSSRTTTDAATAIGDAGSYEEDGSAGSAPKLDAKPGLGGGSACAAPEECLSGACTLGRCSDWAHAMRIAIDTTPSGADVRETIVAFPLLVRLNAANFAFAQARSDGADIRFLDANGNSLAYEIERWDAGKALAEIWVLVPRIAGNSRSTMIVMYWGNQLSASASSGPSVFGDFSCAFHMGQNPTSSVLQIDDASGQGNPGTVQSQSATALRDEGISGSGLVLDGTSILTTFRRLAAPQPMTLSLWLKTTSASGGGIAGFASKLLSDEVVHDRAITLDPSGHLSFSILHGGVPETVASLDTYNDDKWHLITARFSTSGQYLFVDGEAAADDPTLTSADAYSGFWRFGEEPAVAPSENTNDADIGAGYYVAGLIDEARVSTSELSDDWIKLAYATQRPDATAVSYAAGP